MLTPSIGGTRILLLSLSSALCRCKQAAFQSVAYVSQRMLRCRNSCKRVVCKQSRGVSVKARFTNAGVNTVALLSAFDTPSKVELANAKVVKPGIGHAKGNIMYKVQSRTSTNA